MSHLGMALPAAGVAVGAALQTMLAAGVVAVGDPRAACERRLQHLQVQAPAGEGAAPHQPPAENKQKHIGPNTPACRLQGQRSPPDGAAGNESHKLARCIAPGEKVQDGRHA